MAFKVVGAVMVFLAACGSGRVLAGAFRRRPGELRDLGTGLAMLETEIWHGATPLPAALARVASALPPVAGEIFREAGRRLEDGEGAAEAWAGAVEAVFAASAWTPEDCEALLSLAPVLGRSGREDQRRHLLLARERLARQEEQARAQRERYERLWSYLGTLAGAGLVLVFL